MHMTVNFLGLFFRTGKIFFGLTRSSCLSVRMTDNFSASFGKSAIYMIFYAIALCFIMFICTFVGPLIWTNKILSYLSSTRDFSNPTKESQMIDKAIVINHSMRSH